MKDIISRKIKANIINTLVLKWINNPKVLIKKLKKEILYNITKKHIKELKGLFLEEIYKQKNVGKDENYNGKILIEYSKNGENVEQFLMSVKLNFTFGKIFEFIDKNNEKELLSDLKKNFEIY